MTKITKKRSRKLSVMRHPQAVELRTWLLNQMNKKDTNNNGTDTQLRA